MLIYGQKKWNDYPKLQLNKNVPLRNHIQKAYCRKALG
jgi:hypothetical protein